jgi:hypothetical protein
LLPSNKRVTKSNKIKTNKGKQSIKKSLKSLVYIAFITPLIYGFVAVPATKPEAMEIAFF